MAAKFNPGGTPGKLHRELGIPVGQRIPYARLIEATHSKDREVRDDAIRARTMRGWKKTKRTAAPEHRAGDGSGLINR